MIRRCLLVVAVVFGSMPGCGMALGKRFGGSPTEEGSVTRSFSESSHRVTVAAFEVMQAELAFAAFDGGKEFCVFEEFAKPDGTKPTEKELTPNFPAFWVEWADHDKPIRELMTLRTAHLVGKTKNGRSVEVGVEFEVQNLATLVTIRVDKRGDGAFSHEFLTQVADRLAHPSAPLGSIEEASAFKAFFCGGESGQSPPSSRKLTDASKPK